MFAWLTRFIERHHNLDRFVLLVGGRSHLGWRIS